MEKYLKAIEEAKTWCENLRGHDCFTGWGILREMSTRMEGIIGVANYDHSITVEEFDTLLQIKSEIHSKMLESVWG